MRHAGHFPALCFVPHPFDEKAMAGATKRKSAGAAEAAPSRKKSRTSDPYVATKALIDDILDAPDGYELPEDDSAILANVQSLARYARYLEEQLAAANNAASEAVAATKKTPEQLEEAAEKVRKAAVAGIKKQMTVRLSLCLFFMLCIRR